jgi:hypothetical protein
MPNHALLNNVDHKQLRIVTARGAAYGDAVMSALTFPAEFRELQAHYPIVFAKNRRRTPSTRSRCSASSRARTCSWARPGLGNGWDAPYIPLTVERQPFLIGARRRARRLMIHVDLDSPRLSTTEGEPLFLSYGGSSEYLERISRVLRSIHDGLETSPASSKRCCTWSCWNPSCSTSN